MSGLCGALQRWMNGPSTAGSLGRVSFALVVFACGAAWAAGGGHGGHGEPHVNWWTWDSHAPPVGWFIIDFVLFIGLMYYFASKPVRGMFRKRHEQIKESIQSAQDDLAKAQRHRDEYKQKLAHVVEEEATLIKGAQEDGALARDRIIEASKSYSEQLRNDTQAAVEQEEDVARKRLRAEVVKSVLKNVSGMLGKELTEQDQTRLLEEAIAELERGPEGWPGAHQTEAGHGATARGVQ